MSLLQFFRAKKNTSASLAKERLQIIVAEHRADTKSGHSFLPQMKAEILDVIRKYINIEPDAVCVSLDSNQDDVSVLELNVTLPDSDDDK